jgi:hypothetical protein
MQLLVAWTNALHLTVVNDQGEAVSPEEAANLETVWVIKLSPRIWHFGKPKAEAVIATITIRGADTAHVHIYQPTFCPGFERQMRDLDVEVVFDEDGSTDLPWASKS